MSGARANHRRLACAVVAAGSLWLGSRSAAACSEPCRPPPVRLFPPVAEIPGNLIYFKVLDAQTGPLSLVTAQGNRVAASVRRIGDDQVFAPDQPVAAGVELVLQYQQRCLGKPWDKRFAFRTGAHAEITLRPAELQIVEQGARYPGDARNESRFYRVRYYPPNDAAEAAHLVEASATIDGRALPFAEYFPQPPLVFVEAMCAAQHRDWALDSCGNLRVVPTGKHTFSIGAHIIGSKLRPSSVSQELLFECGGPAASAAASSQPRGSAPPSSPSSRPAQSSSRRPSAFGCGTAHREPPVSAGGLLIAITLIAGGRGRRRKPPPTT